MAAETQLFYIGTSKSKEIRAGASVTYEWGDYGAWTNFKSPVAASATKVKYNKNTKNAAGASAYGGTGGVRVLGTWIPETATRTVSGVSVTVPVRYYKRGYTVYTRTSSLKKQKKMKKTKYNKSHPYQYRLQYKDKVIKSTSYSKYVNGKDYIFFSDHYYDDSGHRVETDGHLPHPTTCDLTYFDVRRNFDTSKSNNSDGRDNKGSLVLSNVRTNLVKITLKWEGLSGEEGMDLLDTLNPAKDGKEKYNYLVVQYRDPAKNKYRNKTFYADDRQVVKAPNGLFNSISVTLIEV